MNSSFDCYLLIAKKIETQGKGKDITTEHQIKPVIDCMYKNFNSNNFKKLLSFGCGTGTELKLLKNLNYEVHAIEIAEENVESAKQTESVKIIQGDFHHAFLYWDENYFDILFLNHSFEHFIGPIIFFCNARYLLKDNGIIFINMPDFNNKTMFTIWHTNPLLPHQIEYMGNVYGFEKTEIKDKVGDTVIALKKKKDKSWQEWGYVKYYIECLRQKKKESIIQW